MTHIRYENVFLETTKKQVVKAFDELKGHTRNRYPHMTEYQQAFQDVPKHVIEKTGKGHDKK